MYIDLTKLQPLTGSRQEEIRKTIDGFTTSTPNHADYFNHALQQLIDNDATLEGDTLQAIKDTRRNIIDLALEVELLKGATLNGMTSNLFIENFSGVDDLQLTAGVHDEQNTMLVIR
ncbi:hypothetical protein [Bacillus badius]|uniref:hypothetical protein n=1 Tax=Bacillus badius TaxID=1455 RepID=UPI00059734F4|nr:hypothetical protein [Bacillus badius]KIL72558.1 hypothetical protein SD78_4143 [Bacillus badius]